MLSVLTILAGLVRMPSDSLAMLVGLSAIGLAAFSIHVVSKRRDDDR